jgi:ribosomal protein L24
VWPRGRRVGLSLPLVGRCRGGRLKIKKNDMVEVIAGKDKGARGKVIAVYPREDRVLVEGVNRVRKHTKVQTSRRGSMRRIEPSARPGS